MRFFGIQESIKQALQTLVAHKFRSVLTVLGVIVGTTTTIAVTSIITGMNMRAASMMERFGTNLAFISKWDQGPRFGDSSREEEMRKELTYEDFLAIKQLPHVDSIVALLGIWPGDPNAPAIKYQGRQANQPRLRGASPEYPQVRSHLVGKGRFYTVEESTRRINVVVLGYDVAESLFPGVEPVDKEITIGGQIFRVVGVFEKSVTKGLFGGGPNDDLIVMIPLGTFQKMFPQKKDYFLNAKSTSGHLNTMIDEITELLRRRRHVQFYQPDNFGISSAQSSIESFGKVSTTLGLIIIPIAGMGLLVGGIGVLNIMLVSVTERTKEIGVRRALGARRIDIILQFLIEAMSLTGVGGILGVAVGLFISWVVNAFLPSLPSYVSMFWVVIGFLVAVIVGLISGIWPAIKAAYLDPVEALRYE